MTRIFKDKSGNEYEEVESYYSRHEANEPIRKHVIVRRASREESNAEIASRLGDISALSEEYEIILNAVDTKIAKLREDLKYPGTITEIQRKFEKLESRIVALEKFKECGLL